MVLFNFYGLTTLKCCVLFNTVRMNINRILYIVLFEPILYIWPSANMICATVFYITCI